MTSIVDAVYPSSTGVRALLTGTSTYYDLSSDVVSTIHGEYGFNDNSYTTLVASPGSLSFTVKNLNGIYLFGTGDILSGWQKGIRITCFVTYNGMETFQFSGFLSDVEPSEPLYGVPTARITVTDWMQKASTFPLRKMQMLTNAKIGDGVNALVSMMPIPPTAVRVDSGLDTMPTVFDATQISTVAITEFQRLALSEFAPIYLRMLKTGGEELRAEGRGTRTSLLSYAVIPDEYDFLGTEALDYICTEDGRPLLINVLSSVSALPYMKVDVESGENVLNDISSKAYPRRVDTSIQTLFTLRNPISLTGGEIKTNIRAPYVDPNGGGTKVNANPSTMVTLVKNTDYQMFLNSDGTGTDLTNALRLNYTFGTEGTTFNEIQNTGTTSGWVTKLNVRGYGIYFYEPIEYSHQNTGSMQSSDIASLVIDQRYQAEIDTGKGIVDILVDREAEGRTRIRKMYFNANTCPANMLGFLYLDIGDLVPVSFNGVHLSLSGDYVINRKEFDIEPSGIINYAYEYVEFLPLISDYWQLETVGRSELEVSTYVGL